MKNSVLHYSQLTRQQLQAEQKKKKKKKEAENVDTQRKRAIQIAPIIKKSNGSFLIFPKRSTETSSLLAKNCKKQSLLLL